MRKKVNAKIFMKKIKKVLKPFQVFFAEIMKLGVKYFIFPVINKKKTLYLYAYKSQKLKPKIP